MVFYIVLKYLPEVSMIACRFSDAEGAGVLDGGIASVTLAAFNIILVMVL